MGPYYERQAYYNVNYTCVVPGLVAVLLRQRLVADLRLGGVAAQRNTERHRGVPKAQGGRRLFCWPALSLWLSTLTSSTQVRKIVMSSSPSTRFDGNDICGKAADELPIRRAPWNAGGCHSPRPYVMLLLTLLCSTQETGAVPAGVCRDEGHGRGTVKLLHTLCLVLL